MSYKRITYLLLLFACTPLFLWASLSLKYYELVHVQPEMEFDSINDLNTEWIVFHSFNDLDPAYGYLPRLDHNRDQAFAELLIIRPKKVYLIKDGFEDRAKLKARKEEYKKLISLWGRQRRAQRNLIQFSQEQIKVEQQAGRHSPDYARLGNLIKRTLYREDKFLNPLRTKIEKAKQKLRLSKKYLGKSSSEYKKYEEELDKLQEEFDKRENTLTKDLRERAIGAWEGPLFPYKENEDAKQSDGAEKETAATGAGHLAFFTDEPAPPSMRGAKLYRNTPDGFPDYVAIGLPGKRRPFFQRVDSDKESWVKENLGSFYKSVRNKHVQRYADQYKQLLLRPYKSNARIEGSYVKGDPLCKLEKYETLPQAVAKEQAQDTQAKAKGSGAAEESSSFYGRIDIYSNQGTHYTAIDCGGDGVVETFLVYELGALYWGSRRQIPNTVSIFNNRDPEIQAIIGELIEIQKKGDPEIFSDFKNKEQEIQKSIEGNIKKAEQLRH